MICEKCCEHDWELTDVAMTGWDITFGPSFYGTFRAECRECGKVVEDDWSHDAAELPFKGDD